MRMLLRTSFPNGPFGDPALYVWEINGKRSLLFDCGDLTRFSTRQLLKVSHIFLSHCHIDHFFGFDLFLRVHVGSEKCTTIFGPPETSRRIAGKLQAYTWNLVSDQNFEFIAVDLDVAAAKKQITRFQARNRFEASEQRSEDWTPDMPVLDTGTYQVKATMLDHRTPSMAYAIEERLAVGVNPAVIREMQLEPGAWINKLKTLFLFGGLNETELDARAESGEQLRFKAAELAQKLLIPRQRHKVVYATDGAASAENKTALMTLARNADLLFCETCFLQEDSSLAEETKHFTAEFVARLAQEAGVKKLCPFHFSKRYLDCPEKVLQEVSLYFPGEVLSLATPCNSTV